MSHYAANFVIYAATGHNFRSELLALMRRTCPCCLVTCFRRFAGTGNSNTRAGSATMLEMRQTNVTMLRNGTANERVGGEWTPSRDRKRPEDEEITS